MPRVIEDNNDLFKISDLDEMKSYYESITTESMDEELQMFGNSLRQQIDIPIAEMDEAVSRFYRFVMPQHRNRGVQDREY